MPSSRLSLLVVAFSGIAASGTAYAQQAPAGAQPGAPPPAAPPVAPAPAAPPPVAPAPFVAPPATEADAKGATASGFMVQARMQANSSLLSLGGGPGFLMGYRGPSFALGVGLGLTRLGLSSKESGSDSASVVLFQIVPTAMVDVWHSADGRARADLVGGIGYQRASFSSTTDSQTCTLDSTGRSICTTKANKSSAGATLIPVMVGIGGDYFLSRNFAIGAEGGFQASFLTGVDSESNGVTRSIDASGDMELAYGVIRATLVLGD
jgi:hypothetical protein